MQDAHTDAVQDMARLNALAEQLDAMIEAGPVTVPMLRLRQDDAWTLSVLRERLRRLLVPDESPGDLADLVSARWRASKV